MNEKTKYLIFGILAVVIIVLSVWLSTSHSLVVDNYLKTQSLEGLSFENARIDTKDGITTYEVDVINNTEETYNLKTIEVTFNDSDKNKIITLYGYIGDSIEKDNKKILTASVDKEIENIGSISYKINK